MRPTPEQETSNSLPSFSLYQYDSNSQLHEQLHTEFWIDKSLIYIDF
jgi:hypothetical protein